MVESDPRLLERILRNILANAVRFTDRGGIVIGCRRRGGDIAIQVWDTGCGIPPDQVAAIFKPLVQGPAPARRAPPGRGLGLAIVDQLAQRLGHRLAVQSVPGRGSMFEVSVPRADAAAPGQAFGRDR